MKDRVGRGARTHVADGLDRLLSQWSEDLNLAGNTVDFYPIRAVTFLEVFTRAAIAELVDHGRSYATNATTLCKNLRFDFELVRAIGDRTITLGDIVAHSVSLNDLSQIFSAYEVLLGKPFKPLLETVVDRWAVEVMQAQEGPIIDNVDDVLRKFARLIELRHILCHELPRREVYQVTEIPDLLNAARRFCRAVDWILTAELNGNVPLTQSDMNIRAIEEASAADKELDEIIDKLGHGDDAEYLKEAQAAWLVYRQKECLYCSPPEGGGSIKPLLRAMEAKSLTEERIARLRLRLNREEGAV